MDLGLLQKEVAQQLGVDTNSVTNWEKGHTSASLHLIPRIIEFLGYTPFFGEGEGFVQQIVEKRRALRVRQEDLARQLCIDPSTLARWEQGKGRPLKKHLHRLNEFLDPILLV